MQRLRKAEPEAGELALGVEDDFGGEAGLLHENGVAGAGAFDALEFAPLRGVLRNDLLHLRDGYLGEEGRVEPVSLDGACGEETLEGLLWSEGLWRNLGERGGKR